MQKITRQVAVSEMSRSGRSVQREHPILYSGHSRDCYAKQGEAHP
jgi:hypothetical protein